MEGISGEYLVFYIKSASLYHMALIIFNLLLLLIYLSASVLKPITDVTKDLSPIEQYFG